LACGSFISFFLAWAIIRVNKKLDLIINYLKKDDTHPLTIIDSKSCGVSVRWIIGYFLPVMCTLALIIGFILSCNHVIEVKDLLDNTLEKH
jgi:hypothetical protein